MTFLAPAKLIDLVLLPLHLGVARKPDALQLTRLYRWSCMQPPLLETIPL